MSIVQRAGRPAIVALVGALALYGCGGAEERQARYYERAQALYDEGNYERARLEARNALQISSSHAGARYLMAQLEERERNWRGMFNHLNAAIDADPDFLPARVKMAQLMLATGDLDQATEQIEGALERDPGYIDAMAVRASIHLRRGERDEASALARTVLEQDATHINALGVITGLYARDEPDTAMDAVERGLAQKPGDAIIMLLKAQVLAVHDRTDEVVEIYEYLVTEYPDNQTYMRQLVATLVGAGNAPEAERVLRDAISRRPENTDLKLTLVELQRETGSPEDALQTLEQFAAEDPESYRLQAALAQQLLNVGERDRGAAVLQEVIRRDPQSTNAITARNSLINLYLAENRRGDAEALLEQIFQIEANNSEALYSRARLALADGDAEAAIRDLRASLRSNPEYVEAMTLMAMAQERTGAQPLALDTYRAALAQNANHVPALLGAGRLMIADGQLREAEPLLLRARNIAPNRADVHRMLAELHLQQERWDDAFEAAQPLLLSQQTAPLGNYLQARVHARRGDSAAARQSLERSLELRPAALEPLQALVTIEVGENGLAAGRELLRKHIAEYPDHYHAREMLSELHLRGGQHDEAEALLKALLDDAPDRISAYRQLGALYSSRGQLDRAEVLYRDGLEKNPEQPGLMLLLAEVQQFSGDIDGAIDTYEALLRQQPDAEVVRNNLAVLLIEHRRTEQNLQRAQRLTADLADSRNPAFLDTVGWLQYHLGNYPQAVATLQEAVRRGGTGPEYRYHLGMALYRAEMREQAREQLSQAVEQAGDREWEWLSEARQTLERLGG